MDCEQDNSSSIPRATVDDESRSAVNSLILDYYKKFGRKRDLEQYFSLSTAQNDVKDPSSIFWARMKAENESSDSGERSDHKKSDSSQELCRISIRFPAQDPYTSQEEDSKTKTESTSPPIIIEELPQDSRPNSEDDATKSEDDAIKSDDNSQKSYDVLLDTSLNKLHSPSSSITSQRRLEWDSLADVGYANESDRKTSASSLSTLERLALKQQYSNNDTQQNSSLGVPTAHSTPLDENEAKSRSKKGMGKKSTKIYSKDVDIVEVNVPHSSNLNPAQSINVNLTKHISFNVEKDGKVTVDNVLKDISVSPEKVSIEAEASPMKADREIQTSLTKTSNVSSNIPDNTGQQKIPILISLNTLRNRVKRRRIRMARRKLKTKKRAHKENIPVQEKSGEQLSEAESFEYMPGHIYNQNQITNNRPADTAPVNIADNKSSLESSGILTSESSKGSKHSFTKDLEKSIDLLKSALKERCDDSTLRKELIQQVCQRLLRSRYRDDESTTDFLSGLSFSSKKLGLGDRNNTTTSTSDANNSAEKSKRPKKSILRTEKFNPGSIASTSQSVPNLPVASKSENLVTSNLAKNLTSSNTESDMSSKEKTSSDNGLGKTSSEELYKKYLQALKREEAYKKHLKDKEIFLKQKLVCSDGAFKVPVKVEVKPNDKLKDLINDLTRNNYDDGSGDASKLEGGSSYRALDRFLPNRAQRSHSVFTLSSGISDGQNRKANLKKKLQCDMKDSAKPGPSKDSHYCCCPHHGNLKFTDSSVQVNIKHPCSNDICPERQSNIEQQKLESPRRSAKIISDDATGNLKYVCLCSKNVIQEAPDDFLIYKCSRLNNRGIQLEETSSKSSNEVYIQCNNDTCSKRNNPSTAQCLNNKSSQTNMLIKMLHEQPISSLTCAGDQKHVQICGKIDDVIPLKSTTTVYEATRWIQTEISINPKISEPTLSDINIVSDASCAKLISEHCRQVPKSCTDLYSNQAVASTSAFSDSDKSTGTSKRVGKKNKNRSLYDETERCRKEKEPNIELSENYTIPIHGTNMTLMVSIGSELTGLPNKNPKEMVTECIGTDRVNAIEQATSLREECSKGVQSDKISNDSEIIDHNSNNIADSNRPLMVNTCLTTDETRFGTYPKNSPINERKPFRRANTDTDKIQSAIFTRNVGAGESNAQTKSSIRSNESSNYSPIQQDTCPCGCKGKIENCKLDCAERILSQDRILPLAKGISTQVETRNEKCACGCGSPKDSCKEDCVEYSSRLTPKGQRQTETPSCEKSTTDDFSDTQSKKWGTQPREQTSTQTYSSLEHSEKCSCGCGQRKDTCKNNCKDKISSPKNETTEIIKSCGTQLKDNQINNELSQKGKCGKQPLDKEMDTQTDMLLTQNEKCPCGCGGFKNKCKKSCKQRKTSPRKENVENSKQCKKQPSDKNMETQTDVPLNQYEQCSCGCGGVINKCKKSCKERKSSPRNEFTENKNSCKRQLMNKQIETQKDISRNVCGKQSLDKAIDSGGEENKCIKSSKEQNTTPRNEDTVNKKQCGTQSKKQIDTQTDMSLNPLDCSCGCGTTIDICQDNCIELKTLKEQYTNLDQTVCSVPNTPKFNSENCPCGCGGSKNTCKRSCKEVKSTPRENRKQTDRKEAGTQKSPDISPQTFTRRDEEPCTSHNSAKHQNTTNIDQYKPGKINKSEEEKSNVRSSDKSRKSSSDTEHADSGSDAILNLIQNITKKYTKTEVEKNKRKKCFKEIITVLNYLLDTDESPDGKEVLRNRCESTTTGDETDTSVKKISEKSSSEKVARKLVDKGVQPSTKKTKSNPCATESSEVLTSTDIPGTSSDSAACKVLNKIKNECEKYHQKRCKIHSGKKCDGTSSTSINCDHCRRIHHNQCRSHKCKNHKKSTEKLQKSPVAYNLILQTSESVMSEGPSSCEKTRTLKNIIVKVPKKKPHSCMPFRELAAKFEKQMSCGPPKDGRCFRSKSLPNDSEISSMEEILRKSQGATVREYLEKNRPDFIEKCAQRQTCMRYISETRCEDTRAPSNLKMVIVHTPNCPGNCNTYCGGVPNVPMTCMSSQSQSHEPRVVNIETGVARIANERAVKRDLLSLHLAQLPDVSELQPDELQRLAADLGRYMRDKKPAPKLISEKEMKKHSHKIYKSLPEVVQKREEKRKENIKKTNLLMAHMFKRNLQKKTLLGSVNLSNYSSVIKI